MYKRFTMQENLVIVESPAKAKTIEKFLGKDFMVKSSFGHIRDLSKKDLGINLADGFAPVYEIPKDKRKVVDELTRAAKDRTVWLASDEDREGEAIAWHLTEVLGLPVEGTKRIVFHEITKRAILEAIENPRTVDMNLVNAQQARRVLDRLVGFELSPVLWKKVRPSLSAGRVQSVAVRLLVEREREIIAFRSTPYFRVVAQFHAAGDKDRTLFKAELPTRFESREEAEAFLRSCVGATFTVAKVEEKPVQRYPAPPFTTSTLQQEAGRKLGMSVSQTMSVAQHLYEQGLITYMRTDSVNLSTLALAQCKEQITNLYGEKYSSYHNYKTKTKGAQEAHEAIRPSYIERQAIEGTPAEKRLYDLIWKRTVASQMVSAELDRTTITIAIDGRHYSHAAFHDAAGALQRGVAGQAARRAGHRPPFDLCADHHDDHQPRLCGQAEQGGAEAHLRTTDARGRQRVGQDAQRELRQGEEPAATHRYRYAGERLPRTAVRTDHRL